MGGVPATKSQLMMSTVWKVTQQSLCTKREFTCDGGRELIEFLSFPWTCIHMSVFKLTCLSWGSLLPLSFSFLWVFIITPRKIEPLVMKSISYMPCQHFAFNGLIRLALLLSPFSRWGNWGAKCLNNLWNTYLISKEAEFGSRVSNFKIHYLIWSHDLMTPKHLFLQLINWLSLLPRPKIWWRLLGPWDGLEREEAERRREPITLFHIYPYYLLIG